MRCRTRGWCGCCAAMRETRYPSMWFIRMAGIRRRSFVRFSMRWCRGCGDAASKSASRWKDDDREAKTLMNFASDNTAGIAPEILQALAAGNDGFAMGYGNDDVTRSVERRIGEMFERDAAVFLVPTGTAANALALAHVSPPWGAVFAHAEAHILTDECGAPEFFGGGLKLVGMPGIGCKVTPDTLAATVTQYEGHTPHQVVPAAFSFAQASEAGTIYRPDEIAPLAKLAHAHGMKVHMDGARFANAVARMNASPAEATWKAGVDALSFGATKGGAMAAEAVVFFDLDAAAHMAERRKRAD